MRSSRPGGDSIRRNSVLSLANQLTSAAFTAVLTVYLTRSLGPSGFGLFALAISVGTLATLLADFGLSGSAARFVAEHRDDEHAQLAVIARSMRLKLALTGAVSVALFALAEPIAQAYGVPGLTWPLRGAAIALAGQTLMLFVTAIFAALRRVAANLKVILSESAIEATASIALVALGGGATGAAFGRAIGYTCGGVITVVVLSRVVHRNVLRRARATATGTGGRRIAGYAVPVFVTNSVWTLFTQVDVLLLGALLGPAGVGTFQAAVRINSMFTYAGTSIAQGVAPRMATGRDRSVEAFQAAVRLLVIAQAILVAPLVVWAHGIVFLLLGPEFGESVDVLRLLALYVFLTGLAPLLSTTVNYLGSAGRRIPIAMGALAVNVVLDLLLIPPLGPIGAAIGSTTGFLIYVPAHLWVCRRALGFQMRPTAITLARTALAVVVMGAVLAVAGTGELSPAAWVLGGGAAVLAYLGTLVLTGEITRAEIEAVAGWVARRFTRRAPARHR
jgi:O-antigen/teichoic acid export membrane protein